MTKTIEAIYENGVFRPSEPVALHNGDRVQITVRTSNGTPPDPAIAVKRLLAIADKPDSPEDDGLAGDRHDEIIYGTQDDR